jgi:hypothetical protein
MGRLLFFGLGTLAQIAHAYYDDGFDCSADFRSERSSWSPVKKAWCCAHRGVECVGEQRFDCNTHWHDWLRSWSKEKEDYCCPRTGHGCRNRHRHHHHHFHSHYYHATGDWRDSFFFPGRPLKNWALSTDVKGNDSDAYVFDFLLLETIVLFLAGVSAVARNAKIIFPTLPVETLTSSKYTGTSVSEPLLILRVSYCILHTWEELTFNVKEGLRTPLWALDPFRAFTVWNYTLQWVFILLITVVTVMAYYGGKPPEVLSRAMQPLFEICLPTSTLTTIVFWSLLAKPGDMSNPHMVLMQLVNTMYFLTEFALGKMSVSNAGSIMTIMWSILYIWFAWACHGYIYAYLNPYSPHTLLWPYFFLAMRTWSAVLWYNAMFLSLFLSNLLFAFISSMKGMPPAQE